MPFWLVKPRTSWPATKLRSEEHTSELQSQSNLVCRLLLEKKKKKQHFARTSPNLHPPPTTMALSRRTSPVRYSLSAAAGVYVLTRRSGLPTYSLLTLCTTT